MNISAGLSIAQGKNFVSLDNQDLEQLVLSFFNHQNKLLSTLHVDPTKLTVSLGNKTLNLEKQRKIFNIFSFFINHTKQGISKEQLVNEVYPRSQTHLISTRQMNCYKHNIIKLISRARMIARNSLSPEGLEIEWFPYSLKHKKWDLYQLNFTSK